MDIGCFLVTNGEFEKALLPEKLLLSLAKSLRENGREVVHFAGRSIEVEGVYIPAKKKKIQMMLIPDIEK